MSTVDLSKTNFTLGAPPYKIGGPFENAEFLSFEMPTKKTAILEGLNGGALIKAPDAKTKRNMMFRVRLLESSPDNKYLAAMHESGVSLPLSFEDGETKIIGTAAIEDYPSLSKSPTGTIREWVVLAVNCTILSYGAAAEIPAAGA